MAQRLGLMTAQEITNLMNFVEVPHISDFISGYKNWEKQLQPAGFDVTLSEIRTPEDIVAGGVTVKEAKQYFQAMKVHPFEYPLQTLRPYVLITNETFNMPSNITALCFNRSSLTRLGAILGTAIIDAGYHGHLSFSCFVTQPIRFEPNIAIAQVVFFRHAETFSYHGQYQEQSK